MLYTPRERTRGGFTLIELLVVVAIIGLLISILLPSLRRAKLQARTRVCQSNMRQLAIGWLSYATEWNECLPGSTDDYDGDDPRTARRFCWLGTYDGRWGDDPNYVPRKGTIYPYMSQDTDVYKCPEDRISDLADRDDGSTRLKPRYSYTASSQISGAPLSLLRSTRWVETFTENFRWRASYKNGRAVGMSPPWMIVEEDAEWHLAYVVDSAWGNEDRITDRHDGEGAIAHTDGSVGLYDFRHDPPFDAWKVYYELTDGRAVNLGEWRWSNGNYFGFGYLRHRNIPSDVNSTP